MRRKVIVVFLLHAIACHAAADERANKEEAAKLQGTWNFVALEIGGMKLPAEALSGSKLVIKDNAFAMESVGVTYKGTFKIDVSKKPKTLDLNFTEGPENGNTALAIYELDGDKWKICLAVTSKDRPLEFAAKPGTGFALETLQRAKNF